MSITLTPKIRGFIADAVRVGVIAAAVLVVVSNAWSAAHLPPADLAYISAAMGIINAVVGALKPYAAAAVKSVRK